MKSTYSIKDVMADLTFMLTLTGGVFEADAKGFWVDVLNEKTFEYQFDKNETPKQIVLFQDPLPRGDFYYFNPFAEGLGKKSPADILFYRTIRSTLNTNIRLVMEDVIAKLLEVKANDGTEMDHVLLRMSSVPVEKKVTLLDAVDDKTEAEFKKLFDRTDVNLLNTPYFSRNQTTQVTCDVFADPKWDEKYGVDIRKKSLAAFKATLLGVLGISTPEELSDFNTKYDPTAKSSAKLETTLTTYHKIYARFNEVLPDALAIDLGGLAELIERLPMAYAIAKHMIQPTLPRSGATDTQTVDTSRMNVASGQAVNRFSRSEGMVGHQQHPTSRFTKLAPTHGLMGGNTGRFAPHVIQEPPVDPFAPAVSAPAVSRFGGGGGHAPVGGGYFSNAPSRFASGSHSMSMSPPSNFGSPGATRRYFGN